MSPRGRHDRFAPAAGGLIRTNPPGLRRDRSTLKRWAKTFPRPALRKLGPACAWYLLTAVGILVQVHPVALLVGLWFSTWYAMALVNVTTTWLAHRDGYRDGIKEARFQAMTNWLDSGGTEWRWPPQTKDRQ